jgi:hypothetical protein
MRLRTAALFIVLVVILAAVFAFAPVVYSPITARGGCANCTQGVSLPAYESLSCSVFGVGYAYDKMQVSSGSYHLGCPPKDIALK